MEPHIAGLVLIFVVIRGASFHRVDEFISIRLASIRWNAILEISGLLIALAGEWLRIFSESAKRVAVLYCTPLPERADYLRDQCQLYEYRARL